MVKIYSFDPQLSRNLQTVLRPFSCENQFNVCVADDLDGLSQKMNVPVILLAISSKFRCDTSKKVNQFEDDFAGLMRWTKRYKSQHGDSQVLLLSDQKLSFHQCCQAIQSGFSSIIDYQSHADDSLLRERVQSALERYRQSQEQRCRDKPSKSWQRGEVLGNSKVLVQLLEQSYRASCVSDVPVLIMGESGTGKQRLAEFIHQHDEKRSRHPFITVNCAAITGSLAESELFGHQKGAFTGATESRPGYFRTADGGTILLDEVGELDIALQPKILRVLQESQVRPVGSDQEFKIDVRIIAATNMDMAELVAQNKFRLDLYQRLKVISMTVPPLRQRLEDLPLLFEGFLKKYSHYYPHTIRQVDPHVYEILAKSIGSGNIRELENIVRQILVFKEVGDTIEITDLPRELTTTPQSIKSAADEAISVPSATVDALVMGAKVLNEALDDYEKALLGNLVSRRIKRTTLADHLGITRRTLYNKLQKYELL